MEGESGATTNIISKGTSIEGKIISEYSIRIDGKLKGSLVCKNTLHIGEGGEIEGDVEAMNANISGKVKGKIVVKQKLVLESKSTLIGDLKASKLIIDEGAIFEGSSDMGFAQVKTAEKEIPIK
jgi:cytoskeletal protein CcmA (bactofilin family)